LNIQYIFPPDVKMPSSPSRNTDTTPPAATAASTARRGWLPAHDAFVRRHGRNGEDADTIVILFETEFPDVALGAGPAAKKGWIRERMKE
jgi:hypothetical protein